MFSFIHFFSFPTLMFLACPPQSLTFNYPSSTKKRIDLSIGNERPLGVSQDRLCSTVARHLPGLKFTEEKRNHSRLSFIP